MTQFGDELARQPATSPSPKLFKRYLFLLLLFKAVQAEAHLLQQDGVVTLKGLEDVVV